MSTLAAPSDDRLGLPTTHAKRLYEEWCVARNAVVKAAIAHLFAGGSKADLGDSLMAERLAKHRFETAIRCEMAAQVAS